MKRVYCIVLMLLFSAGNLDMGLLRAETNKETADSTLQVTKDTTGKKAETTSQQKTDAGPADAWMKKSSVPLDLVGCILGVIALLGVLYVFSASKNSAKRINDFERDIRKAKDRATDAKEKAELTQKQNQSLRTELIALKEQLENLMAKKEASAPIMEMPLPENSATVEQPPVFLSKTYYGVYYSKYNGVFANELKEIQEENSTVMLKTLSDDTAEVSIVKGLLSDQLATMIDKAVEILEGDKRNFTTITEVNPGTMQYSDGVWTLENKIQVKLS